MVELGLYESIKDYVKQQLKVRRAVLSNPRTVNIGVATSTIGEDTRTAYKFDSSNDFQTDSRFGPEQFYAYTTQKVCTIRMVSGVDIEESAVNTLLRNAGEEKLLGPNLAAMYMLEGGTKNNSIISTTINGETAYGVGTRINSSRGGFGPGGTYGDKSIRANADDGFGIVPMPGIIDAKINTVSKEGALREATINFSCHNRGQLEILETIYMRPGYNVLLEWGWNPYINNIGAVEDNNYSAISEFFDSNSDFDKISKKIRDNKKNSGGNYDGFMGFVKNFSYQAREDGGYECTTELISNNSLLETLKAGKRSDYIKKENTIEIEDNFLYYLKSIQKNLQKAGTEYLLQTKGTDEELDLQASEQLTERQPNTSLALSPMGAATVAQVGGYDALMTLFFPEVTTDRSKESATIERKVRELNNTANRYIEGFNEIVDLVQRINKNKIAEDKKVADPLSGRGFQSFLNSTILKQVIQGDSEDEKKKDSGFESHIYVRWDLIVQILNNLITDQYKQGKPLAEITYCNSNTPTTHELNNFEATGSLQQTGFYIPYTAPNDIELSDPVEGGNVNGLSDATLIELYGSVAIGNEVLSNIQSYHPILGNSFDYNICLLPHMAMFDGLFSPSPSFLRDPDFTDDLEGNVEFPANPQLLTSFEGVGAKRESIGLIYFNLEYLIKEYSSMRLKTIKSESDDDTVYTRFNDNFSMLEFLKTIWGSVNNACANYYSFDVHTEFERSHVARVVETNFNQKMDPDSLFEFRPQGLESVTRNLMFNSSISKDIASVISIAAQVPTEEQSLASLSFKAFHKNIKSRFTTLEFNEKEKNIQQDIAMKNLETDVKNYRRMVASLQKYLERLYSSNFTSEYEKDENGEEEKKSIISPKVAIQYAQEIEELRIEILNRYPLSHPEKAGLWRPGTTHSRSGIIPLEFSLQLDGISGLIPYQVFKIHKDKLPYDYQGDEVAFIVKNESQSINANGDWVTEITGQLVLLNINPNNDGRQIEVEIKEEAQETPNEANTLDENEEEQNTKIRFPQSELEISQAGIDSILGEEQFRANAYDDFAPNTTLTTETNIIGTLTVGYGTTNAAGVFQARYNTGITNTTTITEPQARELVLDYVNNRKNYLNIHSPGVKFTQGEFDAMMSFLYNTGNGYHAINNGNPSTIMKMLNAGDYEGASTQFERWNKSKGKVLQGLVRRRIKEKELFLS